MGRWLLDEWFGVLSLLLGFSIALFFYLRQKQPKRLDYIANSVGLINEAARPGWQSRVTVSYDAKVVENPYLTTLRILNTGKRAVIASELVEPITVHFLGREPIDAHVADGSSEDLRAQSSELTGSVGALRLSYTPQLMNPGDWFEVVLLHDGAPGQLRVTSRFADQERPMTRYRYDYLSDAIRDALAASPPSRGRRAKKSEEA